MGFNKRYVPEISVLKEQLSQEGLDEFVGRYTRPDALIGSKESLDFVDDKVKEWQSKSTKRK